MIVIIFKFQSDSINTLKVFTQYLYDSSFKFQSDSINTEGVKEHVYTGIPLNSNLILLIPDPRGACAVSAELL